MMRSEIVQRRIEKPITAMPLAERASSQAVREALARDHYRPEQIIMENNDILSHLSDTPFRKIGQKLVKGEQLTFEEAFLGMSYVVAATNKGIFRELKPSFQKAHGVFNLDQSQMTGPAQTFLTSMAQREASSALTPEEVAGMVASAMMDINLRLRFEPHVLETGGMGGDKGFVVKGEKKKVINASTLSAIVLASMDIPVIKHGSYANTSAVGSTEAVEALGVNIYQDSFRAIEAFFGATNFYFSDAHAAKTIHDLSHSPFMRHETINHIIGPMTAPIDRETTLHKVIGVNEGVHPSLIARAYEILHTKGYQRVGNVVVVSGLSPDFQEELYTNNQEGIKKHMMLDEMSPYKTLLGVVQNGEYIGCFIVSPHDFGAEINPAEIQLINTQEELLAANGQALQGLGGTNSDYLAMNTAIGLFAANYLDREDAIIDGRLNNVYLQESFHRCREAILSGYAARHLERIRVASKGEADEKA